MNYHDFLASKRIEAKPAGFQVDRTAINPKLFDWQRDIVVWALARGRAALFADCGLGKSPMQLEWAKHVHLHTGGNVLLLAPLAVSQQTVREGEKFGVQVTPCRSQADVQPGVNITNYEMLAHFDVSQFAGVVLDESSILKAFMGKTKQTLVEACAQTPYRLACTATPAPNDHLELGNHAEFLGVMPSHEMIARWFINDTMNFGRYRLKGHAEASFWEWVSSWAVSLRRPSDIGYSDEGYDLPPLNMHQVDVAVDLSHDAGDALFRMPAMNATGIHREMRLTAPDRAEVAAKIVGAAHGVLYLTGNHDKLAACGSQNTPSDEELSTNPIQTSGQSDAPKAARQRKTANTCASTTKPIASDGANTKKPTPKNATGGDGNDTQTIPSTAKRHSHLPGAETRTPSGTRGYAQSSVSALPSTTPSLPSRTGDVPSVEPSLPTLVGTGSASTTAIKPEQFVGCSAQDAISQSASSTTILSCYGEQSNTSPIPAKLEPWIVWCNTDYEQRELEARFGDYALSVYGSLSPQEKERRILAWLDGERPILISKPSLCGFGLNFQHCHNAVFVGLSYSYEQLYQAVRRIYRFGQTKPVHVYLVVAETEGVVLKTLQDKMTTHDQLQSGMYAGRGKLALTQDLSLARGSGHIPMRIPAWLQGAA